MASQEDISHSLDILIKQKDWKAVFEVFFYNPSLAQHPVHGEVSGRPGLTKLRWICEHRDAPFFLIDYVASLYPAALTIPDSTTGDTPLHASCCLTKNEDFSLNGDRLRILLNNLQHKDDVLVRDKYGNTTLHYACTHGASLDVLKSLVGANPKILNVHNTCRFHALIMLWEITLTRKPMLARIANDMTKEKAAVTKEFEDLWEEIEFLAIETYKQLPQCPVTMGDERDYVMHALIQCDAHADLLQVCWRRRPETARVADARGDLPLHVLTSKYLPLRKASEMLSTVIEAYREGASTANASGEYPLMIALRRSLPMEAGLETLLSASGDILWKQDPLTGLFPFQLAATLPSVPIDRVHHLLLLQPEIVKAFCV